MTKEQKYFCVQEILLLNLSKRQYVLGGDDPRMMEIFNVIAKHDTVPDVDGIARTRKEPVESQWKRLALDAIAGFESLAWAVDKPSNVWQLRAKITKLRRRANALSNESEEAK